MANKVYNLAGGLHSAAAYAGWENELFGGNAVASATALKVGAGSGMTVSVGKGNALIDTGDDYSRRVALTEAVNVTLDQADTSLPRNDLIVIYVDMAVAPVQTVQDNTNGILKVVAVKGTPASSPSDPDAGTIQQTIGAGNPYMTLASIRVNAGASAISSGNITDKRPASPNVYFTTSDAQAVADSRINAKVPGMIVARAPYVATVRKTGTNPNGGPYRINAPAARSGYKFLCWVNITTERYVAVWNTDNPDAPDPLLYCAADRGGSGTIVAQALYVPTS